MRSVKNRFIEHIREANAGSSRALCRAIRRYGSENILIEVLVISHSWEYLCELEKEAIKKISTFGKGGYNQTLGGDGVSGLPLKASHKRKLASKQRAYMSNQENRDRLSRSMRKTLEKRRGSLVSLEHREKLRSYFSSTKWVTNGLVNKRVPYSDVLRHLSIAGWRLGKTNRAKTLCEGIT